MKELSTPLDSLTTSSAASPWLRSTVIVLAGSVFVAVCSHVALPLWFTPVPLTLQPFAVLLLGLVLAPRLAATTLLAYLAEGAIGLPVFAPGLALFSGLAHLFGPTGGYLLAYPVAAMLISFLYRRTDRNFPAALTQRGNWQPRHPPVRCTLARGLDPCLGKCGSHAGNPPLPARRRAEGCRRGSTRSRVPAFPPPARIIASNRCRAVSLPFAVFPFERTLVSVSTRSILKQPL